MTIDCEVGTVSEVTTVSVIVSGDGWFKEYARPTPEASARIKTAQRAPKNAPLLICMQDFLT